VDPAFVPATLTAQAATATGAAAPFFSPLDTPSGNATPFFLPTSEQTDPFLSQAPFAPESPLATPTVDPFFVSPGQGEPALVAPGGISSGEMTFTPTPSATPTPTGTPTMMPPVGVTPTPVVVLVVVTDTPAPDTVLPAGQRPIVYPTPTATPDTLLMLATLFDAGMATAGWIWFLFGSLVFFGAAGVMAGLFFRQQEGRRFDLVEDDPALNLTELPAPASPQSLSPHGLDDDEWPDSLP
jgi:hypothetical protein